VSALVQCGMLPLHQAVANKSVMDVVTALLRAHPDAAAVSYPHKVRGGAVSFVHIWFMRQSEVVCLCICIFRCTHI